MLLNFPMSGQIFQKIKSISNFPQNCKIYVKQLQVSQRFLLKFKLSIHFSWNISYHLSYGCSHKPDHVGFWSLAKITTDANALMDYQSTGLFAKLINRSLKSKHATNSRCNKFFKGRRYGLGEIHTGMCLL